MQPKQFISSIFILGLIFTNLTFAQENAQSTSVISIQASVSCEGVTKEYLKERKKFCSNLKDKVEKRDCKSKLKISKQCIKKKSGKKICSILVKEFYKKTKRNINLNHKKDKIIKKDLLAQLKVQKRQLLRECKNIGLDNL